MYCCFVRNKNTPENYLQGSSEDRFKTRLTSSAAEDVEHLEMALERTQSSFSGRLASATSPSLGQEAWEHLRLTTLPVVS